VLVAVSVSVAVGLSEASAVGSVAEGVSETAVTEGVSVVVAVTVVVSLGISVAGVPAGPARAAELAEGPLAATGVTGPKLAQSIEAMTIPLKSRAASSLPGK
jgi:hypothetical protein